jgi:cysteine desulfurase
MIYLDNNATTRLAPEARASLLPLLDEEYGNPSSMNALGQRAGEAVMTARLRVANALGATPAEVVFTSGATESNHTAILAALKHFGGSRRHIVSTQVEHPSTLKLLAHLAQEGVRVTLLGVDAQGMLDLDEAAAAVGDDTALVSAMWANNETGAIFPVEAIAQIAKSRGALFHTDAVQAAGRLPLDWQRSAADLLSFSGHKLHAAKGCGVLLVRKGLALTPLFFGSQERSRRGGTENMPGIVSLGVAAALLDPADTVRIAALRDRLEAQVTAAVPFAHVNASAAPRVANTSNIRFGGLSAGALQTRLERAGLVASLGAACRAGGNAPSHVLSAMGMDKTAANASLRFSLSRYTTGDEIERASNLIARTALELEWQPGAQPVF